MKEVSTTKKQRTFIKDLASHAIKVIVGVLLVSVLGGIGTSFVIYSNIKTTLKNDIEQDKQINEVIQKIESVNEKVGGTNINTAFSDAKVQGIEAQLYQVQEQQKTMQQTQLDILKILGEINRKGKN